MHFMRLHTNRVSGKDCCCCCWCCMESQPLGHKQNKSTSGQWLIQPELIPVSFALQEYFHPPSKSECDAGQLQGHPVPSTKFPSTNLYTWVERDLVKPWRVKPSTWSSSPELPYTNSVRNIHVWIYEGISSRTPLKNELKRRLLHSVLINSLVPVYTPEWKDTL